MNDLISRQAVLDALAQTAREKFNLSDEFNHYLAGLMDGEMAIQKLPSAEVEPVKHGRWIDPAAENCYRCSVCEEYTTMEVPRLLYHYCPNCGARMSEGSEE